MAVEVDGHVAQLQRDAVEHRRERIARDRDARGARVDVERLADDHGAEIERPGDSRDDDREAERAAVVGTGEIHLAGQVVGIGARPGGDRRGADPGAGGQLGLASCATPVPGWLEIEAS